MPLLDRNGFKADGFAPEGETPLVPFAELQTALDAGNDKIGVLIDNFLRAEELTPFFDRLALIAIKFPSSTDGRGFSIARQLRRLGFTGILRAVGPLFPDQLPQAIACGLDEVAIPDASAERQPEQQWLDAVKRISLAYQSDYGFGENILAARRKARATGA